MGVPSFRYHPDPLGTGSVEKADAECVCCGQERGFVYAGPIYSEEELDGRICPWCIADGSAAEKFDATFTDEASIGDGDLESKTIEEVAKKTPGFSGWQQERWMSCCADGAAFLGPMGRRELEQLGQEAKDAVRQECGLEDDEWTEYWRALSRDSGPTAYVFKCLHCGAIKAYSDCA